MSYGIPTGVRGAANVFDVDTAEQLAKLVGSETDDDDNFGHPVALTDKFIIVGTSSHYPGDGSAYLFYIPEPTALSLLALGAFALIRRRSRARRA